MKSKDILMALGNVEDAFIVEAAPGNRTAKKPIGIHRRIAAVLLAAAVAVAGLGGVVSAGRFNKSFGQLFHSLSESNYRDMLFDINQTAADNGVTVTLMQGLCDGNALYVTEKIEFAPSVLVLTDEMFEGDHHFGWVIDDAIDVVKSGQMFEKDKAVVSVPGGIYQVIEHDEHSMTVLLIYGGDGICNTGSGFFDDNTLFSVSHRNLMQNDSENPITCSFDFTFEIKRSSPYFYTLPEEVYQVDNYAEPVDQSLADVGINPWFIYFSAGTGTGKILDTSLKCNRQPSLEITMNDGTVYTEKNGIRLYNDYFGKDYDQTDFVPCCFETPIDVTEIKSVRIYGYELKPGVVVPGKERVMPENRGKLILPANSPVKFSKEFRSVDIVDYDGSSGKLAYRILHADLFNNLYATGAEKAVVNFQSLDDAAYKKVKHDDSGRVIKSNYSGVYNKKTGELADGYYILELEIEVKNTDAQNNMSISFDYRGTHIFNKMIHAYQYDKYSPGKMEGLELVYLKEDEVARTGQYGDFMLKKGKSRKLHAGFLFTDNNAGGPEQISFSFGWIFYANEFEGYHTVDTVYFNVSKLIEDFENSKKK